MEYARPTARWTAVRGLLLALLAVIGVGLASCGGNNAGTVGTCGTLRDCRSMVQPASGRALLDVPCKKSLHLVSGFIYNQGQRNWSLSLYFVDKSAAVAELRASTTSTLQVIVRQRSAVGLVIRRVGTRNPMFKTVEVSGRIVTYEYDPPEVAGQRTVLAYYEPDRFLYELSTSFREVAWPRELPIARAFVLGSVTSLGRCAT